MKTTAKYKGFTIQIKRDWGRYGYWDSDARKNRKRGVVVTDGFCNVMPGAAWFPTVLEACRGIDALENVGLGFKVMRSLTLHQKIERETKLAGKWHEEYDRLTDAISEFTPNELKFALAD